MYSHEEEPDRLDSRWLGIELCRSIRDIDCRIEELKRCLDMVKDEHKVVIRKRVGRLVETRFCLIYSLMDTHPVITKTDSLNPFESFRITYEMVKRNRGV